MKMTFMVHNEHLSEKVMTMLKDLGIDYYTRWERATGKGHGTEPHLGIGTYSSTNVVLMIAFREDGPLNALINAIEATNATIKRAPDHIRLFQMPLDRIV